MHASYISPWATCLPRMFLMLVAIFPVVEDDDIWSWVVMTLGFLTIAVYVVALVRQRLRARQHSTPMRGATVLLALIGTQRDNLYDIGIALCGFIVSTVSYGLWQDENVMWLIYGALGLWEVLSPTSLSVDMAKDT